jgi:predicted PurR-regulated permease PerM
MKFNKDSKYFHLGLHLFLVIAASMLFYMLLQNISYLTKAFSTFLKILAPLIYAFILAYLLNPIMDFIERRMLKGKKERFLLRRVLSIVLTYLLVLVFLVVFSYIVLPQLASSVYGILKNIPAYILSVRMWLDHFLIAWLARLSIDTASVQDMLDKLAAYLSDWGQYVTVYLPQLYSLTLQITTSIKNLLLAVIISIYMLYSKELFIAQTKKMLFGLFPPSWAKRMIYLSRLIHTSFGGFISGKIIDSLIIGVLCFIGMSIFRINYPILISVIIGITNIIPYFGPFLGGIPSVLLVFFVSPVKALVLAIFILALQQFDGNILGPKILGASIGLPPFWIIFAVIVGGGLFGLPGMFIGVPVFAVIYTLLTSYVSYSLRQRGLPVLTEAYKEGRFPSVSPPPTATEEDLEEDANETPKENVEETFENTSEDTPQK